MPYSIAGRPRNNTTESDIQPRTFRCIIDIVASHQSKSSAQISFHGYSGNSVLAAYSMRFLHKSFDDAAELTGRRTSTKFVSMAGFITKNGAIHIFVSTILRAIVTSSVTALLHYSMQPHDSLRRRERFTLLLSRRQSKSISFRSDISMLPFIAHHSTLPLPHKTPPSLPPQCLSSLLLPYPDPRPKSYPHYPFPTSYSLVPLRSPHLTEKTSTQADPPPHPRRP